MEKFAVHPKHDSKEHGKKHKRGRKAIEQVVRNSYAKNSQTYSPIQILIL